MRSAYLRGVVAALAVALLISSFGCSNPTGGGSGGGGGGSNDGTLPPYDHDEPVQSTTDLSVTEPADFVHAGGSDYYALLDGTDTTLELSLSDIPAGGEVYFVFSNPGVEATDTPKTTRLSSAGVALEPQSVYAQPRNDRITSHPPIPGRPEATEFSRDPAGTLSSLGTSLKPRPELRTSSERRELTVGSSTDTFAMDYDGNTLQATLRYENTADGITLRIWVPDNAYEGGDRDYLVNQTMVNAMGEQFLKAGEDNDIYDWVTAIYGEPWGTYNSDDLTYLLPADSGSHIDILLFDIDGDNQDGTLGYYWPKDNYEGFDSSNERLMFYIDSVYYADGETGNGPAGWSLEDYYPAMQISTLAHELQHMIHFYQKSVLRTSSDSEVGGSDTWVNEMLSLMAEDFVSQRLQAAGIDIPGPRGVVGASEGTVGITAGRLPGFNLQNDWPVTQWYGSWADYAVAYAFGAYLARNYGGEDLMTAILQTDARDRNSIEQALTTEGYGDLNFEEVFRLHPVAVFLSDAEAEPDGVTLNLANDGAWFSGGSAGMQLGQIDHYNYPLWEGEYGPWTWFGTADLYEYFENSHGPGVNIYVDAASDGTADQSWKVTLPEGVYLTVVVKG
ncbi:MAG: hypothetical protein GVY29_05745 [Spirochaetes bacterium]|jgi:hypothetical protein|nr:hypothetical protein [Spirochaetota bacterium]